MGSPSVRGVNLMHKILGQSGPWFVISDFLRRREQADG
jgi:hypothetical protein